MLRSQDGKLNSNKSGGDSLLKEKKKTLEQAYGVPPVPPNKPKPPAVGVASSRTSGNPGKTSSTKPGQSQQPSKSNNTKRVAGESPLVAASRARHVAQKKAEAAQQNNKPPVVPQKKTKPSSVRQKPVVSKAPVKRQIMKDPPKTVKPPSPAEEENYEDDDFEEDYPSDFEEVESTASEDMGHDDDYLAERAAAADFAREQKVQSVEDFVEENNVPELHSELLPEDPVREDKQPVEEDDEEGESSSETDGEEQEVVEPQVVKTEVTLTYRKDEKVPKPEVKVERPVPSASQVQTSGTSSNKALAIKSADTHGYDFGKSSARKERLSRGKKLQGMIRFDKFYWELLHLKPSYEQFMLTFSGSGRVQQANQTDRDVTEVAVQTEVVEESVKWTQKPPTWSTAELNCDIRILRQEALGVGTDAVEGLNTGDTPKPEGIEVIKNWSVLSQFINRASKKVMYVLESQKRINLSKTDGKSNPEIKMNRGLSVLSKLEMSCLSCDGDFVACSNGHSVKDKRKHTSKNIITIWSLKEPSNPMYFLRAWGQVTVLKMFTLGHLAFAGFKDGTISAWDLDEATQYHSHYQEQLIRTPSVTTSCMESSHTETVKGLGVTPNEDHTSLLLSIDHTGLFMVWVCRKVKATITDETYSQHSSAWGHVYLSLRQTIRLSNLLKSPVLVSGFSAWRTEDSFVEFIATTVNGFTLKGMLTEGDKLVMKKYQPRGAYKASITSFDISWELNLLLTGCIDSQLRIYDIKRKKLILTFSCESSPISVRWSKFRSSMFYVGMTSSVAVWDILVSDISPSKTMKISNLQGFDLYSTSLKEFPVILQSNELKITSLVTEVKPLTPQDQTRIESYIALLLS